MRAARKIRKGEEVTTSYTLTLQGTSYRRKHLKESKYFDCTCQRCQDPTELGSHFSTILCPDETCQNGLITPVNPMDYETDWQCNKCQTMMGRDQVARLEKEYEVKVEELPMEMEAHEQCLQVKKL